MSVFGQSVSTARVRRAARMVSGRYYGPVPFSVENAAVAAGTLYASPFIPSETVTIDQLAVRVVTAAVGNCKVGVYLAQDADNMPGALLAENTADLDTNVTNTTLFGTFATNPTLVGGRLHWLVSCYSGTPTMACWASNVAGNGGFPTDIGWSGTEAMFTAGGAPTRITTALPYVAGSAFFPATFGTATEGGASPGSPLVALRKL